MYTHAPFELNGLAESSSEVFGVGIFRAGYVRVLVHYKKSSANALYIIQ
jgi:hypothetical protein